MTPTPGRRSEQGSGTLEFVGVVVLAAVLVAATVGAVAGQDSAVRSKVQAAICAVTGAACGPAGGGVLADADFEPSDCEVTSARDDLGAMVDIAFVRLQGGGSVQRVTKSNGEIEITVAGEGGAGLVASTGGRGEVTIGGKSYGASAEAEAAVTAGVSGGDTYVFQDPEKADAFESYIKREFSEDIVGASNPVMKGMNWVYEQVTDEQPPENDGVQKWFVQADVGGEVHASGSLGYGAGAGAEVSGMRSLGTELDRGDADDPADDTRTVYYELNWGAGFNVSLPAVKGFEGATDRTGTIKVTYDEDREPVQMQLVDRSTGSLDVGFVASGSRTGGGGSAQPVAPNAVEDVPGLQSAGLQLMAGAENHSVVVTQTLDLRDGQARAAFDDWFDVASGVATADLQTVPGLSSEQAENVVGLDADAAQSFADVLSRQARTSIVEYDGSTTGLGVAAELGLGLKVGLDVGGGRSSTQAVEAHYLGAPTGDGARPLIALDSCAP